jgi:hypothetical protein
MKAINKSYDGFILSNYPRKVTVGSLKELLTRDDQEAKIEIIDFIFHRLNHRYLVPLLHVPREYKSGFLMMASACLMIETMQSFYEGKKETKRGDNRSAFKRFFERHTDLFPGIADDADNFYRNIRCGILHQAETRGGYRILRQGPLFSAGARTINANAFLRALAKSLKRYADDLHESQSDSALWKNAQRKVRFISKNCQS